MDAARDSIEFRGSAWPDALRTVDGSSLGSSKKTSASPLSTVIRSPAGPLLLIRLVASNCLVLLVNATWVTPLHAEVPPLVLRWDAPAECPTQAQVESEVMHLVSKVRFSSTLEAEATIRSQSGQGYRLLLRTVQAGAGGERDFTGRSCRAVSDAAIVTMALSLDPNLSLPQHVSTRREPSPADESVRTPQQPTKSDSSQDETATSSRQKPAPARIPAEANSDSKRKRFATEEPVTQSVTPIQGLLHSAVGWSWGALPHSTAEIGLGFGIQRGRLALKLQVVLSPPVTSYSQRQAGIGGEFLSTMGDGQACWAFFAHKITFSPCLGMALTRVGAQAVHVDPHPSKHLVFASSEFGVQAKREVTTGITLFILGNLQLPLKRPAALVLEDEVLYQPNLWIARIGAGAEWQIW